ncbi:PAS domain S-box protein [Thioalkalivibrio thiocyanodenitrificans]|uniref:PAS domain S-box protein n=1 Tax=Thioalkalivibrio thiocyanodenitrificans TaxID=243063 RepID=UPI000399D983|nr:PAS domain S-box protein [Thioalkalivibrio thiocyanodenitrificans]
MPAELSRNRKARPAGSDSDCRKTLVRRLTRMHEALVQFDHRQRMVYANPAARRLFGLPDGNAPNTPAFADLFEDPGQAEDLVGRLHQLTYPHHEPFRLRRAGLREAIIALIDLVGLYDADGRLTGFEAYITDITAQRAAEDRLRASERRLRTIVDAATDGLVVVDPDSRQLVFANEAMSRMLGRPREELLTLDIADMHPPRDRNWVLDAFRDHAAGLTHFSTEIPVLRRDGTVFVADISSSRIALEGQTCLLGVFRDVTERVRARNAERRTGSILKAAQRIAHLGYWVWDRRMRGFRWSEELWHLLGDPPGETASYRALLRRVPREERPGLMTTLRVALDGFAREFEFRHHLTARDGSLRVVHSRGEVLMDRHGQITELLGTVLDITASDADRARLEASEARLREFTDIAADWLWELGPDLRLIYLSPNARELLGVDPFGAIGKSCEDCHRSQGVVDTPEWREFLAALENHRPFHDLTIHWRPEAGRPRYLSLTGRPRLDAEGRFLGFRGVGRDITDQQVTQRQLHRVLEENRWLARNVIAAREHERKRLARELHDELGQLLTAVRLDAESILAPDADTDTVAAAAGDIMDLTARAQSWARAVTRRLHPLELDQLGLIDALRQEIGDWGRRNPLVRCEFSAPEAGFEGLDEHLALDLYRIVQESLTNIAKYARAGEIRICLAHEPPEPSAAEGAPGAGEPGTHAPLHAPVCTQPGGRIHLLVRDDGVGIQPTEVRMGLGVLGMRERVESHGGMFELCSRPGHGLSILVSVPLDAVPAATGERR